MNIKATLRALWHAPLRMRDHAEAERETAAVELAKAGIADHLIRQGGSDGVRNLATVTSIPIRDAAEITATVAVYYDLTGDLTRVVDVLTAATFAGCTSILDLWASFREAGLVAAHMQVSLEETAAVFAVFAEHRLEGGKAGAAFKNLLLTHMDNPVDVYVLADDIKAQVSHYPGASRLDACAKLFGLDACIGAEILAELGSEGLTEWVRKVDVPDFAADMAAKLKR